MSSLLTSSWNALSTSIVVIAGLATILVLALWLLPKEELDPREPPLAKSRIPVFGHVINMLWYHNEYFSILQYVIISFLFTREQRALSLSHYSMLYSC